MVRGKRLLPAFFVVWALWPSEAPGVVYADETKPAAVAQPASDDQPAKQTSATPTEPATPAAAATAKPIAAARTNPGYYRVRWRRWSDSSKNPANELQASPHAVPKKKNATEPIPPAENAATVVERTSNWSAAAPESLPADEDSILATPDQNRPRESLTSLPRSKSRYRLPVNRSQQRNRQPKKGLLGYVLPSLSKTFQKKSDTASDETSPAFSQSDERSNALATKIDRPYARPFDPPITRAAQRNESAASNSEDTPWVAEAPSRNLSATAFETPANMISTEAALAAIETPNAPPGILSPPPPLPIALAEDLAGQEPGATPGADQRPGKEKYALQNLRSVSPLEIAPEGTLFPEDLPPPEPIAATRNWEAHRFHWEASGIRHFPLYFEDMPLERYGHSLGPLQPIVSSGQFLAHLALAPYSSGMNPPLKTKYALGYHRPGERTRRLLYQFPLSMKGALHAAGAWTGNIITVP